MVKMFDCLSKRNGFDSHMDGTYAFSIIGNAAVSKTVSMIDNGGSNPSRRANTHIAQMNRALGYDPRGYRFESYYGYN